MSWDGYMNGISSAAFFSRRGPWARAGLVLALALLLSACGNLDERAIRRQLERLRERAEKTQVEKAWTAYARAESIGELFAEDARIETGLPLASVEGRREIVQNAYRARAMAERLRIRFPDVSIAISNDEAVTDVTVEARGNGESYWQPVRLSWIKEDGTWRIARAVPLETIRRPSSALLE